jgi:hypothetical protein
MNVKIKASDITYGPQTLEKLDELYIITAAHDLYLKGYRRMSNAYCCVGRIDRDDWLDVLAKSMNTCRADYYNLDGSGISDSWRDHYIRCHSKDTLTVNPYIHRKVQPYR